MGTDDEQEKATQCYTHISRGGKDWRERRGQAEDFLAGKSLIQNLKSQPIYLNNGLVAVGWGLMNIPRRRR